MLSDARLKQNKKGKEETIRISFIGNVRFFDINRKLIDVFKNDSRYILCFHGTNSNVLEEYAKEVKAENVECSGAFPVDQTKNYLEKADIINNIFGCKSIGSRTLTSIRLFHAAYMHIPILVSGNTYMENIIKKYGIGFVVNDVDSNIPSELYDWYHSINQADFTIRCEKLLQEAEKANSYFEERVNEFIL